MEDLELIATVFDMTDVKSIPRSPSPVNKAKIGFARTHVWPKAGPGLKAVWERARSLLSEHGADIEDIELPGEFSNLTQWHSTVVSSETRASLRGGKPALT